MDENIIRAVFEDTRRVMVTGLWQWDYGQTLKFVGLPGLPDPMEVHFTQKGEAKTVLGTADGDVLSVSVPDAMLQRSAMIGALVFLHNTEDDGETEYRVYMPVRPRAQPETYDEDDPELQKEYTALVQATQLLTTDIESVDEYAQKAKEYMEAAQEAAREAGKSVSDYEGLTNRPKIQSVELIGDKTFEELGMKEIPIDELISMLS